MSLNADQLYALMPAIYRTRDAENGEPLSALMSVIAEQAAILEENIEQLFDDEFIETCAQWVVPYIGDLVGCNPVYEIGGVATGRRAEVANTIGYRRRKGTLLALEQVAMDVSGLHAAAVECFKRLITTESMHHIRPRHEAWLNLRRGDVLERMGSAFDKLSHTVDVRRIAPRVRAVADPDPTALDINLHGGGIFNIPNVAVYLWRWKSFKVTKAPAFQIDSHRYMFSPLGQNIPLFNALQPRESFSRLTGRLDVPQPILRREFYRNVDNFYGLDDQGLIRSLALFADDVLIDASKICCRDLSDCTGQAWPCTPPGKIGIDPALGRIQFASDYPLPQKLEVRYCYGFPAEIGGGPYDRTPSLPSPFMPNPNFRGVVGRDVATLEDAIQQWNGLAPGSTGLIVLPDFAQLDIDLTGTAAIRLPAQSQLWIISAQVPPGGGNAFKYEDSCVTLRGNIEVDGQGAPSGVNVPPAGQLFISGVWISGSLTIGKQAADVQLMDCTLVPGIALTQCGKPMMPGQPSIVASGAEVNLSLTRCITGPIGAFVGGSTRICSSIVDSGSRCSVAYAAPDLASEGTALHIEDSTVIGKVHVELMELASNTIFLARLAQNDSWSAALWCSRRQAGCIRFCFLPATAITPQQFRCLPPDPTQEGTFLPQFVTLEYGRPSYAMLSGDTPMAVWTGADDGSQMGVYHLLQETEAVRNVQLRAPEFLPFGMEAGVFLIPSRPILKPLQLGYGYGALLDPCSDAQEDELRFLGIGAALI
jgi:hypothetical protein